MEQDILQQLEASAYHFEFKLKEGLDGDYRSAYQRDLGRIIHSAAFRRLQTKTQVMGTGEGDFHRTRLTHSIEVGQIGRGLCLHFENKYKDHPEIAQYISCQPLMEAICYAHDIGHPAFGHGGEVALQKKMKNFGGFEGNAQTIRQLARLEPYYPQEGIRPSRRLVLGVLKYPAHYGKFQLKEGQNHPPKCYYEEDDSLIQNALSIFDTADIQEFCKIGSKGKTIYKTIDASIMELADDIAYGVHDIEDAIARKLLSSNDFTDAFLEKCQSLGLKKILYLECEKIGEYLFGDDIYNRKNAISALVGYFIQSSSLKAQDIFASPFLDLKTQLTLEAEELLSFFQYDMGWLKVITKPEIQTLEFKGQKIVDDLFTAIWYEPLRLIGKPYFNALNEIIIKIEGKEHDWQNILSEGEQKAFARAICDFIAQMTDPMAEKYYKRLYVPSFGNSTDEL
ncbi:MAG: anti-phage deoxyguanosine triphosphatase [Alphaproteobacteria bacterium]